ncbi:MAG: cytochrome c-type biogenesis protein CcmH [bacterium]|nr:cytochrome c-type biogenesis protein CcmH [bacterium]
MRRAALDAAASVLMVLLLAAGHAQAAPTLDDQIQAIANELMCPVCAGQTVAESGAQLAVQMRAIIRERLQQGQTREQIIAYFVVQFGEGVLAAPPRRGIGLLLWLSLPLVLGIGFLVLRRFVRRNSAGGSSAPGRSAPRPPTPAEAERIERRLRELE